MASVSLFALTRFTALAAGDILVAVDVSDATQSAHGSVDAITVTNFFNTIPVPVTAVGNITTTGGTVGVRVGPVTAVTGGWHGNYSGSVVQFGVGGAVFGHATDVTTSLFGANYYVKLGTGADSFMGTGAAVSLLATGGALTVRVSSASGTAGNAVTWVAALALAATTGAATFAAGITATTGSLTLSAAGGGIVIKEGSNATMGTATLNGVTGVTVNTTKVTANSRIFVSRITPAGTPGHLSCAAVDVTPGTSFKIVSTTAETSTVCWVILEPA